MEMGEPPEEVAAKGGAQVQPAASCSHVQHLYRLLSSSFCFVGVSTYLVHSTCPWLWRLLSSHLASSLTVAPLFFVRFITVDPGHIHHGSKAIEAGGVHPRSRAYAGIEAQKINFFRIIIDKFNLAGFHKIKIEARKGRLQSVWIVLCQSSCLQSVCCVQLCTHPTSPGKGSFSQSIRVSLVVRREGSGGTVNRSHR